MSENRRVELKVVGNPAEKSSVPSGARVTHDARGNAVWDWAVDTAILAKKTAADLIQTLDALGSESLSLELDAKEDAEHLNDPYNRPARVTGHRRAR
jgi:hypothetical protein